jgi:heme A synthase
MVAHISSEHGLTVRKGFMNRAGSADAGRNFVRLALGAAIVTFILIVIGSIVRVTGSGMGCGTDWPSCNGQFLPNLSNSAVATVIEMIHRLFTLVVGLAVVAVAVQALRRYRAVPQIFILAMLGVVLYLLQAALGALTVASSNAWWSVMIHLANAMLLLASYVIMWLNARSLAISENGRIEHPSLPFAEALIGTALAYGVVLLGAVVVGNDAYKACGAQFGTSWPLCFGQVWPSFGGDLAMLNMAHRLIAGLLGLALLVMIIQTWRSKDQLTRRVIRIAGALYLFQAAVGALVILVPLENNAALTVVRALHVTFAAATWWAMVAISGVSWLQQHSMQSSGAGQTAPNAIAHSATISN